MKRVMIVDDVDENRYLLLSLMKSHGWEVVEALNGSEALEKAKKSPPSLVISDLLMPVMDGYTLLHNWKENDDLQNIPFIVYTATYTEPKDKQLAMELGADDFIIKPMDPKDFMIRVDKVVDDALSKKTRKPKETLEKQKDHFKMYSEVLVQKLEKKINELQEANENFEEEIEKRKKTEEALRKSLEKLSNLTENAVSALAYASELRDQYTAGHQKHVMKLATSIAKKMELEKNRVSYLRLAAMVHDVGKIIVPAEILNKPGQLNSIEISFIRQHPVAGRDIFKQVDIDYPVSKIIYQHHERIDGSGYPEGIKGDEMMLEAKILAVSDVVEAMSSHRPYRPAPGIDAALEEIEKNSGTLYDPEVVNTCLQLFREEGFNFDD